MYTITVLSLSLSGMYKSATLDAVFDEINNHHIDASAFGRLVLVEYQNVRI